MIRHIVMMTFAEREKLDFLSSELKTMLMALENSIESLKNMEVGFNFSTRPTAHDIVLIADFDNKNGLDEYRVHPEHVKVLNWLKGKVEKSAVVDYQI